MITKLSLAPEADWKVGKCWVEAASGFNLTAWEPDQRIRRQNQRWREISPRSRFRSWSDCEEEKKSAENYRPQGSNVHSHYFKVSNKMEILTNALEMWIIFVSVGVQRFTTQQQRNCLETKRISTSQTFKLYWKKSKQSIRSERKNNVISVFTWVIELKELVLIKR